MVKQAFINFAFNVFEDALSLVKGKDLDLSVTSFNTMASSPNFDLKFFDSYSWTEMSNVDPLVIIRVMLDDPSLDEVVKLAVSDFNIDRRLLHHMVFNIILPRTGKFEYVMFLNLFVMYCLLTRRQINLGHLLLNHMKDACEKKRHGLPYGMLFIQIFQVFEVDMGGEEREKTKTSKEYNKNTLRLMGFIENEEGEWVKKGVTTPQQSVLEDEKLMKRLKKKKHKLN